MTQKGFTPAPEDLPDDIAENGEATSGVYLDQESLTEVLTILGDSTARHVGVIRAGIKVPIRAATKEMFVCFEKMALEGKTSDEIDKALLEIAPDKGKSGAKKSWTAPYNCQHFSTFGRDFKHPTDAVAIRQRYGDEKGRIYEFPIWFPKLDYQNALRGTEAHFLSEMEKWLKHGWRGFGAGRLKYYSEFAPDGKLACKYRDDVNEDKWKTRPCPGLDDPETCADFKRGACKFGGIIRGTVPGVRGVGECVIHTNSWHAFKISIGNLRRVWDVLGRVHGTVGGKPFLQVTKQHELVGSGAGRKLQWIIVVEPCVDMLELAEAGENERLPFSTLSIARPIHVNPVRVESVTPPPPPAAKKEPAPPPPAAKKEPTPPPAKKEPAPPPSTKPSAERIAKTRAAMSYIFTVDGEAEPPDDLLEKYALHNCGVPLDQIDTDTLKRVFDTMKIAASSDPEARQPLRDLMLDLCRETTPEAQREPGDEPEPEPS